jgi:hypothetical protein
VPSTANLKTEGRNGGHLTLAVFKLESNSATRYRTLLVYLCVNMSSDDSPMMNDGSDGGILPWLPGVVRLKQRTSPAQTVGEGEVRPHRYANVDVKSPLSKNEL